MKLSDIFVHLKPEESRLFQALLKEKTFPKGHILIKEGQIATYMFYITQGVLRSFFYKNGENITDYFFFEEDFASDFASYYSEKASLLNLECLEDTTAFQINRQDLLELSAQYPIFEHFGRVSAEYAFLQVEERMRLLHTEDLETKFRWMMEKFPAIFLRVPQYHIASYLGVKPESLSRIKRKIGNTL